MVPDVGLAKMLTLQQLLLKIGDDRWQDVVLSAGNIFFCFTLLPMLRHPGRPPLLTCIPTGLALLAGGFCVCDPAFMAHSADSDDNGTSVARSSFQKISSNRPGFAERLASTYVVR